MKPFALIALAGLIAGAAIVVSPMAARAQSAPTAPAPPPTQAVPPIGPADPGLRVVELPNGKRIHLLPATLETTQWGWFDNAQPPVLRINSGDTVALETMMHSHNQIVPGTTIEQIKKLRTDYPGRGPHTVTGPIYVEGAEPGDVLKVTINKIVPRSYAVNFNVPGMFGEFPKDFPDGQVKYLYLDLGQEGHRVRCPASRFRCGRFPAPSASPATSPDATARCRPGDYAGNIDVRDLVEGTTLYVPVFVSGALLWTGDSHAAQGNGEVNLTALETAYKEMNITVEVVKGRPLDLPRIETPTSWITLGLDRGSQQGVGSGQGADRQIARRAAQGVARTGGEADGCGFRLSREPGGRHQEGHSLPQSEKSDGARGHGASDQGNAQISRFPRQGRGFEQGHGHGIHGDDQVAGNPKEASAARCLWTGQRRHGLPRGRDLRQ